MPEYPAWVKQYRTRGTAIKKVGNQYYLYKHTSKYVPGKKYPQAVDKFIGVITPDGVVENRKKKVTLDNIEVYEYGFSYALLSLCPEKWKKDLGNQWKDVLYKIIYTHSPNSYLFIDYEPVEIKRSYSVQERKLFKQIDVMFNDLFSLNTIYLIKFEEWDAVSKISESQNQILTKIGIEIKEGPVI